MYQSHCNYQALVRSQPQTYRSLCAIHIFLLPFFFYIGMKKKNGILSLEVCFVFVFEHLSSFPLVFLLKFDINSSNLYFWLHYERYYHVDLNVFIFPGNGSHS